MQEQGVRPDDPDYLKAQNLLQAVRNEAQYRKKTNGVNGE